MNHKIGVHWIKTHGRPEDLDYIRRLQPPSVKLVAGDVPDVQWISDTYQAAPNTLIVLRSHAMSEQKSDMAADPTFTGRRHAQEWYGHIEKLRNEAKRRNLPFPPAEQIVVLGINEPEVWNHLQQTVDYTVAFLDACAKLGMTAGALNLSVGWPANTGTDTPPNWTPYEPVHAALIHGRHYLFLHEYHDIAGPAENRRWWCGRYLQCPWQDVRIIVGEYGIDRFVKDGNIHIDRRGWRGWLSADQYAAQIREYHESLLQDKRIHSLQIYSSDYSHPWSSFDLPDLYPALLAYAGEVRNRPAQTQPQGWTGYVSAPAGLNLRNLPSTNGDILRMLKCGDELTVLGNAGDWLTVQHEGATGYVFAQWVSREKPEISEGSSKDQRSDWQKAITFVLRWEGGLADNPNDPGGLTNFGISQRSYHDLDIRNLTKEQAVAIYERDYWQASGADKLPWPLALIHLDSAVNAGVGKAQQWLQQSGGNATHYMALRLDFYTRLNTWQHFGLAWVRRIADLMKEAA
jgi:uncharacterized protein YgiM (DUF1202 family)